MTNKKQHSSVYHGSAIIANASALTFVHHRLSLKLKIFQSYK